MLLKMANRNYDDDETESNKQIQESPTNPLTQS